MTQPPQILGMLGDPLRWQLVVDLGRSDRRVGELVQLVGKPQNLVSYHLGELRRAGIVSARRSAADGRDVYYRAAVLEDPEGRRHSLLRSDFPLSAGWTGRVAVAEVPLQDGPRLYARLVDVEPVVGMAVEVSYDDVSHDLTLARFRPAA